METDNLFIFCFFLGYIQISESHIFSPAVLQVHIQSNTSARLYERVDLDITGSVLKDVKINDTTRQMYILAEQKVKYDKRWQENANSFFFFPFKALI